MHTKQHQQENNNAFLPTEKEKKPKGKNLIDPESRLTD
jgi:hypothetical protein